MRTSKDKIKVVIYVSDWRIEGDLHILADSRLTDALNARLKEFLVLTDAKIYDVRTGEFIAEAPFIDVNRLAITMIYAVD